MSVFQATPQNLATLARLFDGAQDQSKLQSVHEQLEQLNPMSGFRSALVLLITDVTNSPLQTRLFAASCLKNTLPKWWRRSTQKNIGPDEKEPERIHLRQVIFQALVAELDPNIATILASCMATIAVSDFPIHWPDFAPLFFNCLETTVTPQHDPSTNQLSLQLKITPQQSQYRALQIAKCCFDTLNLVVHELNGRNEVLEMVNTVLIQPSLAMAYQYWVLYNGLLAQLIPQAKDQIKNAEYLSTMKTVLGLVLHVTSFLSKCVQLHPKAVLAIEGGQLADNIFQQFGQCISSFQSHISPLPSHQNSIAIRNQLNAIRGHCSTSIAECITLSPILFRKYLKPYAELFVNILKQRGDERSREFQMLAIQHGAGEVGVALDTEADEDLTAKGQDPCIIQSFNFLAKLISNKAYRPEGVGTTNALLHFHARDAGMENTIEAQQIALGLMNDQWCLGLGELIMTKFLGLLSYDIEQICNFPDTYFTQLQDFTEVNSERAAAIHCYQRLYERTPQLMTGQIKMCLQQITPLIPQFVDLSTPQSPHQSQSERILQSWQVDNVLYALKGVLSATQESNEDFDHAGLAAIMGQALQTFCQTIVNSQHNPQVHDQLAVFGEGVLNKIVFDSHPTSFQRIITCCQLLQEIGQYLNGDQICSIWDCVVPYVLIDNHFVQLIASQTIQVFADSYSLGETESSLDGGSNTKRGSSARVVQSSVRALIQHGVMNQSDIDTKVHFLTAAKLCLNSLTVYDITPLIPVVIQPLSVLWNQVFVQNYNEQVAGAVVRIISTLVDRLGTLAFLLDSVVMSILSSALSTKQYDDGDEQMPILIDSTIELWDNYLTAIPFLTDSLVELFHHWCYLLKVSPLWFSTLQNTLGVYFGLAGYLNPNLSELQHDRDHVPPQIQALITSLPQQVQQVVVPIQPTTKNFFAIHGNSILDALLLSITVPESGTGPLTALDSLLNCVDASILFGLPSFAKILDAITVNLIPAMYYEIRLTGLISSLPDNSSLRLPLPTVPSEFTELSRQAYGVDEPQTLEMNQMASMLAIISRLLVTCPQHTINYFANLSSPQVPNIPIFLATPLNLFFSTGIHMCDESGMSLDFLRKPFAHGLSQCMAIYQYATQQLQQGNNHPQLQAFITMMNNDEYANQLFTVIFTQCAEDEAAQNSPFPVAPIDFGLEEHLQSKSMGERRLYITINHDTMTMTRLKDRAQVALQILEQIKGKEYLQALLRSISLDILLAVDLRV